MAFAILLFQDIAAIPLIALVPMLGDASPHPLPGNELQGLLEVFGSIALVVLGGRYLLRPVFRIVSRSGSHEVSTATALLVVIGTAWLMELAGISMALGVFLAGMLLADSEYRHELESHIEPFKGLLLGLFFMSVGMVANLQLLWQEPLLVLGLTLLLIGLKLPVLLLVGRLAGGLSRSSAMQLAVLLAAGGEFAFVVFRMARSEQLLDAHIHDLLVIAITLSMAVTPLLVMLVAHLFKSAPSAPSEVPPELKTVDSHTPRVVLAGMGRMGQVIARVLRAQHVPFVALDNSVDAVEMSRSLGQMPIFYGNPLRPEILRAAQVDKAEWFIVATDDPETNLKTTELVRKLYPHVKVIARARNRQHVHKLWDLNALAVRETFHSSLEMSHQVLRGLGLSEEQAAARLRRFKRHDEEVLEAQHRVYDNQAEVQQTARQARDELENLFNSDQIDERRDA